MVRYSAPSIPTAGMPSPGLSPISLLSKENMNCNSKAHDSSVEVSQTSNRTRTSRTNKLKAPAANISGSKTTKQSGRISTTEGTSRVVPTKQLQTICPGALAGSLSSVSQDMSELDSKNSDPNGVPSTNRQHTTITDNSGDGINILGSKSLSTKQSCKISTESTSRVVQTTQETSRVGRTKQLQHICSGAVGDSVVVDPLFDVNVQDSNTCGSVVDSTPLAAKRGPKLAHSKSAKQGSARSRGLQVLEVQAQSMSQDVSEPDTETFDVSSVPSINPQHSPITNNSGSKSSSIKQSGKVLSIQRTHGVEQTELLERSLDGFRGSPVLREHPHSGSDIIFDSESSDSDIYGPEEGWRDGDLQEIQFNQSPNFSMPSKEKSPGDYFKFYFANDLVDLIVAETNLYYTQKNGKSLNVTSDEIYAFFGILIYMGICQLPSLIDYWASPTRIPQIADVMSRKRFQDIHANIHFHNNEERGTDRLLKIRPLLNFIRKKCQELEQEYTLSVDERMQKYKGTRAGNLRQYMPDKPSSKWGFKLFVLAGSSGTTYDFIPYCGADTFETENLTEEVSRMGMGASAVIALCQNIKTPAKTTVTFDNFYTSIPLIIYLRDKMNLYSLGTIKRNRTLKCPLADPKALAKKGRGSYDSHVNKNAVLVVQWADNKVVCLASSFVGVEPIGTIKRHSKDHHKKIDVDCPRAVLKYNESMGGVDLGDMLMALYTIPTKAKRWYFSLFGYCLEVALTNSWLLYKRDCILLGDDQKFKSSKEFRTQVSEELRASLLRSRGRPSLDKSLEKKVIRCPMVPRPSDKLRTDNTNHWPTRCSKGRCRYCQSNIRFKCTKCDARLCITPERNCFVQFHVTKDGKLPVNETMEDEEDEEDVDEVEEVDATGFEENGTENQNVEDADMADYLFED
ncbi:PiggyBac transposable element-derived protein 3 [Frankliniella fusca]|uniref:PiggyBac transposable element-derived protein 3 n=1 Tax=Frankliniella fusca TaxID=407009 RepID=A0AAE1LWG2_9NEOP|nr:PiggyBac transposable element-derived protein 3 [Frankliniella fusca]